MTNNFYSRLFLALLLTTVRPLKAALIVIDGGMVYDSLQNLTWLQDANYANTHGFESSGGAMDWTTATNWVGTINVGGYTNWRLPNGGLEFPTMFLTELGNNNDPSAPTLISGSFTNIQFDYDLYYWTTDVVNLINVLEDFTYVPFYNNSFKAIPIDLSCYVWPVRTGMPILQMMPMLQILRTTTNTVVLSWPMNFTGFTLEQNTSLATANWMDVTNGITTSGANNQVSISLLGSSSAFFRLKQSLGSSTNLASSNLDHSFYGPGHGQRAEHTTIGVFPDRQF